MNGDDKRLDVLRRRHPVERHGISLPVVDLAEGEATVASALRGACTGNGFFYLIGHGIAVERFAAVFAASRALFALPEAAKEAISRRDIPGAPGYKRMGDAAKEEYYLRHETDDRWPARLPAPRETLLAYFEDLHTVSARLMAAMALSLDLPRDHFAAFCTDPIAALRLVRYAPEAAGAGAHRDFGSLTLLLQDEVGGLQVLDRRTDAWIDALPLPGALVVNVGNLFERWTNDRYRSSLHRVVKRANVERFSVPFFLTGAADHPIACLPSCLPPGETPLYPPTTVAEHLRTSFAVQGF